MISLSKDTGDHRSIYPATYLGGVSGYPDTLRDQKNYAKLYDRNLSAYDKCMVGHPRAQILRIRGCISAAARKNHTTPFFFKSGIDANFYI